MHADVPKDGDGSKNAYGYYMNSGIDVIGSINSYGFEGPDAVEGKGKPVPGADALIAAKVYGAFVIGSYFWSVPCDSHSVS